MRRNAAVTGRNPAAKDFKSKTELEFARSTHAPPFYINHSAKQI